MERVRRSDGWRKWCVLCCSVLQCVAVCCSEFENVRRQVRECVQGHKIEKGVARTPVWQQTTLGV